MIFHRAEIIKIEHPTRGDDTRAWGPPYAPYSADSKKSGPGESAYFIGVSLLSSFHPKQYNRFIDIITMTRQSFSNKPLSDAS